MSENAYGLSGFGSFAFFIDETLFGGGSATGTPASPVAPVVGDYHIPFNPMDTLEWEEPQYDEYMTVLMGYATPTRYSTVKKEAELSLTTIYHAPFLLTRCFGSTTTGSWDSNANATIACTMSNYIVNQRSICIHIHVDNRNSGYDSLDDNLFGGLITSYKWEINTGEPLKEIVKISVSNTTSSAIAFNSAPTYHDQRFAKWNPQWLTTDNEVIGIMQNKISITTTTAIDAILGSIDSASIEIKLPHTTHTGIGYESNNFEAKQHIDCEFIVKAKLLSPLPIDSIRTRIESRSNCHCKMQINEGTTTQYLQCSYMKLQKVGGITVPGAKDDSVMSLELTFAATTSSAITYNGTYLYATTANPAHYVR